MSGLGDKAKDAAHTVKEKAVEVLEMVDEKAEELSKRDGIIGKAAGFVDKALDKVTGGDHEDKEKASATDEATEPAKDEPATEAKDETAKDETPKEPPAASAE